MVIIKVLLQSKTEKYVLVRKPKSGYAYTWLYGVNRIGKCEFINQNGGYLKLLNLKTLTQKQNLKFCVIQEHLLEKKILY